jgi:hypothetical protein
VRQGLRPHCARHTCTIAKHPIRMMLRVPMTKCQFDLMVAGDYPGEACTHDTHEPIPNNCAMGCKLAATYCRARSCDTMIRSVRCAMLSVEPISAEEAWGFWPDVVTVPCIGLKATSAASQRESCLSEMSTLPTYGYFAVGVVSVRLGPIMLCHMHQGAYIPIQCWVLPGT